MPYHFLGISPDWAQVIATLILFGTALWAGIMAMSQLKALRRSTDIQIFSALLSEIAVLEASHDRGLVRSKINDGESWSRIRDFVICGRHMSEEIRIGNLTGLKPNKIVDLDTSLLGSAVEWTIVRYDRVAFFILGNGEKPRMDVPKWIWRDVNMILSKLHEWITYRQTTEDKDFHNPEYACYLEKLASCSEAKELREQGGTNHD